MAETCFENYPLPIVLLALLFAIASWVLGALLVGAVAAWLGAAYVALCLLTLAATMCWRCKYCAYYGKRCYCGLGIPAGMLFKKGNAAEFRETKNLVPAAIFGFGTLLLPIIAGAYILLTAFSWDAMILLGIYLAVAVIPTFFLKKNLFCNHCRQAKLGCPAYEGMTGKRR
ncbi:MAG: hypothetical protein V1881_01255 [Candidatus Micrarchaeota archaeon]